MRATSVFKRRLEFLAADIFPIAAPCLGPTAAACSDYLSDEGIVMQQTTQHFLRTIIGAAVCTLALQARWAQGLAPESHSRTSDPARWYQDDTTPRARFQTLKKEAGAAYQEAVTDCKRAERASRATCMQEARTLFEQDMTAARQQTGTLRR